MTKDVLFRWEDSPSLRHHCGFCERPLSHPGAKSSCIGIHAEPCHRFHQALFMRNRGHCCAACIGADEAHHKRHTQIADTLREMYELRGEDPFLGGDNDTAAGAQALRPHDSNCCPEAPGSPKEDLGSNPDVSLLKKKERKDFRKLEKAKNRPKVVTLEEIDYIESILHPNNGTTSAIGGSEPANFEEVDEIERNLRYNAKEYNTGVKRTLLQSSTSVRNAHVNFEVEMERILCALRVRDPIRRSVKDQSLKGKSLTIYNKLGKSLEEKITEDLILVKKDELETRMRRASFLRYINRTSFDILQDRYSILDWKTGERILSTPEGDKVSEPSFSEDENDSVKENVPLPENRMADVRHISPGHHMLGTVGPTEIDYAVTTSRNPLTPTRNASLPPTLRITPSSNSKGPGRTVSGGMGLHPRFPPTSPWPLKATPKPNAPYQFQSTPSRKPQLQPLQDKQPNTQISFKGQFPEIGTHAFPSLGTKKSEPASRPPKVSASSSNPWKLNKPSTNLHEGHAPVSQKKPKKNRDKTRKAAQYAKASELTLAPPVGPVEQEPYKAPVTAENPQAFRKEDVASDSEEVYDSVQEGAAVEDDESCLPLIIDLLPHVHDPDPVSQPPQSPHQSPLISTNRKVDDWKLFSRQLILEGLSDPFTDRATCVHRCKHRGSSLTDCPFHTQCPPYDPITDTVFLVYPSPHRFLHTGPFSRMRGEKLLQMFNADANDIVKGRLMLVDDDIYEWITRKPTDTTPLPARLKREMAEFTMGMKEGCGLRQETRYNTMSITNGSRKKQPTTKHLEMMGRKYEPEGAEFICYCMDVVRVGEKYVECSHGQCRFRLFHKKCIRSDWLEGMRDWYCCECEWKMEMKANELVAWLNGEENDGDEAAEDNLNAGSETEEEPEEGTGRKMLRQSREQTVRKRTVQRTTELVQIIQQQISERVMGLRNQGKSGDDMKAMIRTVVEEVALKEGLDVCVLLEDVMRLTAPSSV